MEEGFLPFETQIGKTASGENGDIELRKNLLDLPVINEAGKAALELSDEALKELDRLLDMEGCGILDVARLKSDYYETEISQAIQLINQFGTGAVDEIRRSYAKQIADLAA
ncbi:hypothetical protein KJ652_03300 [Patescibacteria group bacterium]|nr:hypothetical protein [Patescibacteria group bacterium]MBU1123594.1 hypothetical protein [Patescibacteria group bacterium]